LSAQETKVVMSAWLSRRSLAKWPYCGSANHGGIFWLTTATLIAFAQGRASLYVRSDIGATSPGRWQPWQFFCKMGSTSRLNVTGAGALEAAAAAIVMNQPARDTRNVLTLSPLLDDQTLRCHHSRGLGQTQGSSHCGVSELGVSPFAVRLPSTPTLSLASSYESRRLDYSPRYASSNVEPLASKQSR
jgi:hypothetical protein